MNTIVIILAVIAIAIFATAIYATREMHRIMVEALNNLTYDESDEYEYKDDPYAEVYPWWLKVSPLTPEQEMMDRLGKTVFTCHKCCDKNSCRFAFDAYNTNGDCLMAK